jgi:hypothetical protein
LEDFVTAPLAPKPSFPYKTQPFGPYQRDVLTRSALLPFFFLAMEQGTGKTWVTINTAALLFLRKKIDAMIVLAPNGVHTAWALEQLPAHMPDVVPWRAHIWNSGKELTQKKRRAKQFRASERDEHWALSQLARDPDVFPVLCVNSESCTTPLAKKAIGTMLTRRRCLFVVDESGDFTTPSAKRTRALMTWRERAPYRRCLDGTPVGVEPFELYAPYRFLSPAILGYATYAEMKERHAEWDTRERGDNGREFKVIRTDRTGRKLWKDLDVLARKIAPHTFRITKAEALPHLPPKIFHKRFFEMTEEQWRLTNELREEMQTELAGGGTATATNVLTQYLRYQQIASGYIPPDVVYGEEVEPVRVIPGPNPRLELAVDECLRHAGTKGILWCRFQFDVDLLAARLRMEGFSVVTYDGRTSDTAREEAKARFQQSEVDWFIGNPAAGGRGLNLYRAEWVMYYGNYFGLRRRLQSEDRAHRIGTKNVVNYTDLLGARSIDLKIVRALRNNQNVADVITGDPAKDWI